MAISPPGRDGLLAFVQRSLVELGRSLTVRELYKRKKGLEEGR
jgi:hypothetical protein